MKDLYESVIIFCIEAEFNMLYGEQKSDSLCLGFGMTANLIIHQAKRGRKCAEEFANSLNFDLDSTEPSSENLFILRNICCALILLPLLLPQRVFRRNGPKKLKIPPTSSQTLDHFIQFIPVGEGIDKFMKDDRLLGGERRQPFVLAIGEKCRPQQIFLIFEDNCIEVNTILKAVDLCFKLTFILNLEFSSYCSNVWHFLNNSFYKGDLQQDMPSCVRELKSRIF
ncbi:UNVERIFIED_CONTAM: hypothetical protein NCL1_11989 [Trichonephila clavipes]